MTKVYTVMSGKGGVGKSSISILISSILSQTHRVLLLDFDISAPSITCAFKIKGKVYQGENGLIPISVIPNLNILSMALLTNPEDAIIWRSPKKIQTISLFYNSIKNDCYDFVVIDTPPGITEIHQFIALQEDEIEAIIITTPQNMALSDALSSINFCKANKIKIKGLVENMAGFSCEECGYNQNIFARKGGELLAKETRVNFMGAIPIDPLFGRFIDEGNFLENYEKLKGYELLKRML